MRARAVMLTALVASTAFTVTIVALVVTVVASSSLVFLVAADASTSYVARAFRRVLGDEKME
jgi:hypothetical protein